MTNFEKYKDEILKISKNGTIAVNKQKNMPVHCSTTPCSECIFRSDTCTSQLINWLYEEYQEPAPKLTKKERAFCEILGTDYYIVRDKAGRLLITSLEPFTDGEKWMIMGPLFESFIKIDQNFFPFITWEPAKAWSIEDLLKLEVEE